MAVDFPSHRLLAWYQKHGRDLPWRQTKDPYAIWVSEIMCQQTRVDTVIGYYQRWMQAFPTLQALAEASEQEVLKCWEGLGYYRRARHLHQSAKWVVEDFDGVFPNDLSSILSLKGIGAYTSAAIGSIAFGIAKGVVDGNVLRVATRYLGIEDDIRKGATIRQIQTWMDSIIDPRSPGDFNQAMMELGATLCSPTKPTCEVCPLSSQCIAYATASTASIPYKSPAKKVPHYPIGVAVIKNDHGHVLIGRRRSDQMLGGLWEFPGGKQEANETIEETVKREILEELGLDIEVMGSMLNVPHAYSHFKVTLHVYECRLVSKAQEAVAHVHEELRWIPPDELNDYPFPKANKTIVEHLQLEESITDGFT